MGLLLGRESDEEERGKEAWLCRKEKEGSRKKEYSRREGGCDLVITHRSEKRQEG